MLSDHLLQLSDEYDACCTAMRLYETIVRPSVLSSEHQRDVYIAPVVLRPEELVAGPREGGTARTRERDASELDIIFDH